MGVVAPRFGRRVPGALRPHRFEGVSVQQRPDALALSGGMDRTDADAAAPGVAIDLVVDDADDRSPQLGHHEPASLPRPGQRPQVPSDGGPPVQMRAEPALEGLAGRGEGAQAEVENGVPVAVDIGAQRGLARCIDLGDRKARADAPGLPSGGRPSRTAQGRLPARLRLPWLAFG
jgi:hypothetical protein